jgi:hypothetical protein
MVELYCRGHHARPSIGSAIATDGSSAPTAAADLATSAPGSRPAVAPALDEAGQTRLCPECTALLDYAHARLARCPYAVEKPTCAKCPTHCYRPAMREQVRAVMRYSGPRMLTKHPLLAAAHLIDGRRRPPAL